MLALAARERPPFVLLPDDSIASARGPAFEPLIDSATAAASVARARRELLDQAQTLVAFQPTT